MTYGRLKKDSLSSTLLSVSVWTCTDFSAKLHDWKWLIWDAHLQEMRWGQGASQTPTHAIRLSDTNTELCEDSAQQHRLTGLHSCTLTQAPQTCGYHKGPCHMLSRYIPTQWCQFVHLNLRLLIYSSETLQLKDKVNTVQSFFFFHHSLSWSINSDFAPTAGTRLFSASSDEMCESATTANTTGWFQSILAGFVYYCLHTNKWESKKETVESSHLHKPTVIHKVCLSSCSYIKSFTKCWTSTASLLANTWTCRGCSVTPSHEWLHHLFPINLFTCRFFAAFHNIHTLKLLLSRLV